MRTLLAWHVYAGIIGPILALLHTGHRFESLLGIVLTGFLLTIVVSGFTGRYLMSQISRELREKQEMLSKLAVSYAQASEKVQQFQPGQRIGWAERLFASLFSVPALAASAGGSRLEAVRLAQSMADVEYAIKTHTFFKIWFARWLKFHIAISVVFYILIFLHIGSEVYYGLRWLS